jgi:hypothetical protein
MGSWESVPATPPEGAGERAGHGRRSGIWPSGAGAGVRADRSTGSSDAETAFPSLA